MSAGVVSLKQFQGPAGPITEPIVIGKDILDLLTGAMYVEPLSIYREYVQNAADAIQEAKDRGLYHGSSKPSVQINIDAKARTVRILDNGIGVPANEFIRRLSALGASKKRGTELRGFRGVGRLSGLGYCQELIFRSRAVGDRKTLELSWDGKKLKDLLRAEQHTDVAQAIRDIAQFRATGLDGRPEHFFEVELRGVSRVQNDALLNPELVSSYLSQVAPVPFPADFPFGDSIADFIARYMKYQTIDITLNGNGPIFRPHRKSFHMTDKVFDSFSGITYFEVPGVEEGVDAIGWILGHSYLGAIPKRSHVAGMRARVGNLQVGGPEIFESLFPQPRFNSWCVGEIHVLTRRILPNGRRDDFEVNGPLQNLHGHLAKHAKDIVKACRDKSVIRNRLKSAALLAETISQSIALMEKAALADLKSHLLAHSAKLVAQLEQLASSAMLGKTEKAVVFSRVKELQTRLQKMSGSYKRGRDAFSRLNPTKRKAYEDAIESVLSTTLPISIRAELVQKIVRRAVRRS